LPRPTPFADEADPWKGLKVDVVTYTLRELPIEAGRGILDSKAILAAQLKINYQGLVAFEYEKDGKDPVLGLAESIGYNKGLLAGLK